MMRENLPTTGDASSCPPELEVLEASSLACPYAVVGNRMPSYHAREADNSQHEYNVYTVRSESYTVFSFKQVNFSANQNQHS